MPKLVPDQNIDLMLEVCEGTDIHVCSALPTTFLEATSTFNLASDNVGAYVKANGDVSGRKNTQAGTIATPITATGTATHIAITSATGSVFEIATETTAPQALTSGGTVDIGSFDHELGDAA